MLNFTIFKQGARHSRAGCIHLSSLETMIFCVSIAADVWYRGASYWLRPCYVNLVRLLPGEALPERRVSQCGSLKPYNRKRMWHQSKMFWIFFVVSCWVLAKKFFCFDKKSTVVITSHVYRHSHTQPHTIRRHQNKFGCSGLLHYIHSDLCTYFIWQLVKQIRLTRLLCHGIFEIK